MKLKFAPQENLIAIGGVGGSGTRVLAAALLQAGYYLGDDLNESLDNLLFTLLFKDRRVLTCSEPEFTKRLNAFVAVMSGQHWPKDQLSADLIDGDRPGTGPVQHDRVWLAERLSKLLRQSSHGDSSPELNKRPWGWKEPNTHIVLDKLSAALPKMKYIHLVRSGFDMAFSGNQNQLKFWGRYFLKDMGEETDPTISPANSLAFWCRAEKRVRKIGRTMGERFLMIHFEELCANPPAEISRLLNFVCGNADRDKVLSISSKIKAPDTIGRASREDPKLFRPQDIEFAETCGYKITGQITRRPLQDGGL